MSSEAPAIPAEGRAYRAAFLAFPIWLVLCVGGGVLFAALSGEHGSVIFVIVGLFAGLCGAVTHAILLLVTPLRAYSLPKQSLLVSALALLLCATSGAIFYGFVEGGNLIAGLKSTAFVLMLAANPVLVVSYLACKWLSRAEA